MIRAWWGEFRNGVPVAAGILTLLASLALGATVGRQPMLSGCADPLNVGLILAATVSPIAVGAGATHVWQLERTGLMQLAASSGRGRGGALLLAWSATAVWQILAFVGAQTFSLMNADLSGYCSSAMLILPASAAVFLVLMAGVGVLLGSGMPHPATGAVLAAIGLLVVLGMQRLEGEWSRFVPTYIYTYYQPFFEPNVLLNLSHIALYGALCAVIWSIWVQAPAAIYARIVAVCLVAAAVAFTQLVDVNPVQYRQPQERECAQQGASELCVWPESSEDLQAGLQAINRARGIIGDRIPTPALYLQEGLSDTRPFSTFRFDARVIDESALQSAALRAMVPQPECDVGIAAWFDILDWLTAATEPQYAPQEALAIREQPDAQQTAWLVSRYQDATTACG